MAAAGYSLRPGTAGDLPLLGAIERDAAQAYRAVGYDFCATGPVRDDWELRRALDDGAIFVAEAPDGALAGFALVWRLDGEAHLLELAVAQAHQRRGLGRALAERAESWARDRGCAGITLTSFRDVTWNAPLYARWGYAAFEPGPERSGLAAVQAEERDAGYAQRPRVAMRKTLV